MRTARLDFDVLGWSTRTKRRRSMPAMRTSRRLAAPDWSPIYRMRAHDALLAPYPLDQAIQAFDDAGAQRVLMPLVRP